MMSSVKYYHVITKTKNLEYIFMILVGCTTLLPSLVEFGQLLQEITGLGTFTTPGNGCTFQMPQDKVKVMHWGTGPKDKEVTRNKRQIQMDWISALG